MIVPSADSRLLPITFALVARRPTLAGCKQYAIFTDLLAKLSNFGLQAFNDLVLRAVKELCMDPSRLPRSAFVATVD